MIWPIQMVLNSGSEMAAYEVEDQVPESGLD